MAKNRLKRGENNEIIKKKVDVKTGKKMRKIDERNGEKLIKTGEIRKKKIRGNKMATN